jgi:hypothetical protein
MGVIVEFDLTEFHRRVPLTMHFLAERTHTAVESALDAGVRYARSNHPHTARTGDLTSSENLWGEITSENETQTLGVLINKSKYARHVEYPTRAHIIRPKAEHGFIGPLRESHSRRKRGDAHRTMLRFVVNGKVVFARMVRHPGTHGFPFMQPAADYAAEQLVLSIERVTLPLLSNLLWQ